MYLDYNDNDDNNNNNNKWVNVYISRQTRYTNSYNEHLLIVKRSTCFVLFIPSSGATFFEAVSQLV